MFVARDVSLAKQSAVDAYNLVFVAEPALIESRENITDLMATLTAIASPAAIERSVRRFSNPARFIPEFKGRLQNAIDAVDRINLMDAS